MGFGLSIHSRRAVRLRHADHNFVAVNAKHPNDERQEFVEPMVAIADMIGDGDWERVEGLAQEIGRLARMRRLGDGQHEDGVVALGRHHFANGLEHLHD